MRYNSLINNVKASEWGLNLNQAYLFAWFYELPSWANKVIIQGDVYYFASKNKACEELSLLTDKRDTMYRYYKQIEDKGLVKIKKIDGKDYISLTKKATGWNSNKSQSDTSDKNPRSSEIHPNTSDKNPTYNVSKDNTNKDNNKEKNNTKKESKTNTNIPDLNSDNPNATLQLTEKEQREMKYGQMAGKQFENPDQTFSYCAYCIKQEPHLWKELKSHWGVAKISRKKSINCVKEFATWVYSRDMRAKSPRLFLPLMRKFFEGQEVREFRKV